MSRLIAYFMTIIGTTIFIHAVMTPGNQFVQSGMGGMLVGLAFSLLMFGDD